jgi:hypothetical protein
MSNAFEDAMNHGFSAADMAAEEQEFVQDHGCIDCEYYRPGYGWRPGCRGNACDLSYKGGRT